MYKNNDLVEVLVRKLFIYQVIFKLQYINLRIVFWFHNLGKENLFVIHFCFYAGFHKGKTFKETPQFNVIRMSELNVGIITNTNQYNLYNQHKPI